MVARPGSETLRAHSCKSISGFIFASNHLHSSHNTLSSSQITHSSHSPTVLSILSHTHSSSIAHPSTGESHPSTGKSFPKMVWSQNKCTLRISDRKLGQIENHLCVDRKIRAHSCKSISGFIFASNIYTPHTTPKLLTDHALLTRSDGTLHPLSHALLFDRTSKHRRVAPQHRWDRATNPPTDRPTSSTGEIAPQTHEPIDPPSEWPTFCLYNGRPYPFSFSVSVPDFRVCLSLLLSSQICESTTNILRGATPLAQPIASNSARIIINAIGWASCTLTSYVDLFFFFLPFLLLKFNSNSRFFF